VPITDDIMARARGSDRAAIETILSGSFPAVHRMTHALSGNSRTATLVERHVLQRAIRVMPRWRKGITPENWFYHHALLVSREAAKRAPPADRDLLVTAGPGGEPAYVAFVRALRGLPQQQMEAFLLNHGEKLNSRLQGVAMDCSAGAAATHLTAATDALRTISGESFNEVVPALERAYAALTPPETVVRATVAQQVSAGLWSVRLRRWFRRAVILALLCVLGYVVWRWHALLIQWFQVLRSRATTQNS